MCTLVCECQLISSVQARQRLLPGMLLLRAEQAAGTTMAHQPSSACSSVASEQSSTTLGARAIHESRRRCSLSPSACPHSVLCHGPMLMQGTVRTALKLHAATSSSQASLTSLRGTASIDVLPETASLQRYSITWAWTVTCSGVRASKAGLRRRAGSAGRV